MPFLEAGEGLSFLPPSLSQSHIHILFFPTNVTYYKVNRYCLALDIGIWKLERKVVLFAFLIPASDARGVIYHVIYITA